MERREPHLLIVDDDGPFLQMLAWTLRDLGYRVTLAKRLDQARARLRDRAIDGLLLDIYLPDGTAFDLLDELPTFRIDVAVFLMSAALDDLDSNRVVRSVFVRGMFAKPLAIGVLHRAVYKALCGSGLNRAAILHR